MQVLYVTDFLVEPHGDGVDLEAASADCLSILGAWLVGSSATPITSAELLRDGHRDLSPQFDAVERHVEWTHVSAGPDWATRAEVRNVSSDGSHFVALVTIGHVTDTLRVRVTLGREAATAGLSPAEAAKVLQPGVVGLLADHPRLKIRAGGQVQDGQYIQVRTPEQVGIVAAALNGANRLPILLVHTRTEEASKAAMKAAGKLVGLARVVTLNYRSARLLHTLEARVEVPYAGGLLVWADIDAPPLAIGADVVNSTDRDALRAALMEQIAPLSVLTRGSDEVYASVQRSAQHRLAAEAAERTAAAVESGSQDEIIHALEAERNQALQDAKFATELWEQADTLAQANAAEAARYKAQADQLRLAAKYTPTPGHSSADVPTLENVPTLMTADAESLDAVCRHLEQVAEGRIVFTPSALAAWRRASTYGTPEEMRGCLTKLAHVAHDLYDDTERSVGHVDTWVRENYDLKISLQDDAMPKTFRSFAWEDQTYGRTPHVKVNDGVPPDQCGRIYFAFDKVGHRIIVDHVGLHW